METERKELFEVVLIKTGASELSAKPGDFKHVRVSARDPLQARMSSEVDVEGYRVLDVLKPGGETEAEIMSRRREMDPEGHPTLNGHDAGSGWRR